MSAKRLFLIAVLFIVVGLVSLGSKWNGSAGFNAGDSIAAWAVTLNGSVHGWPALIGIFSLVTAIGAAIAGLIRTLLD